MPRLTKFIPKYQHIIDDYRTQITNGTLKPGTKLVSREEMATRYDVNRATVNRAMSELLREGLITASQKSGTFVAEATVQLDQVALVVHDDILLEHIMEWGIDRNFFSMYGQLLTQIPEEKRVVINALKVREDPTILRPFRRIIWSHLSLKDFQRAVAAVGDRRRFLLLNLYYPDCDFISVNHRQAAFDLAESFLNRPGFKASIGLLDVSNPEILSNRFVWTERRAGFMDACQKHDAFFRLIEMQENDFDFNQQQLEDFDRHRDPQCPTLILSPSKELMGSLLGFWRTHQYVYRKDYFYGDFNNDECLKTYGMKIPTVSENFTRIAEVARQNLFQCPCQHFIPHELLNVTD